MEGELASVQNIDHSCRTDTSINENLPSVLEYEIPAFLADKTSDRNRTTEAYFTPDLTATDAVYAMWIGP